MFKLIFFSILLFHVVKCEKYLLDNCYFPEPGEQINKINSLQQEIFNSDENIQEEKFNIDFDAEGADASPDIIFELTEDNGSLKKKENLEELYILLKSMYAYLNLTFNETDEETKKCIAKIHNKLEDSLFVTLMNLQNDVEAKLKYVQPILKQVCTTFNNIRKINSNEKYIFTIPYELTTHIRKLFIYNLLNGVIFGSKFSFEEKLKVFESNDCILQEHVLPNIIEFFKTSDKKDWLRITSSLKAYTDQCLNIPEDIQKIKSKIPSSSIKNLIFEDTVCLRNVKTNSYLKSINIHNMSASIEKKITYYSNKDSFTIQNPNGKYMQVLSNRRTNLVGSQHILNDNGFWKLTPVDGNNVYLFIELPEQHSYSSYPYNRYTPLLRYLYIKKNVEVLYYDSNAELNAQQWAIEVDCKDIAEIEE